MLGFYIKRLFNTANPEVFWFPGGYSQSFVILLNTLSSSSIAATTRSMLIWSSSMYFFSNSSLLASFQKYLVSYQCTINSLVKVESLIPWVRMLIGTPPLFHPFGSQAPPLRRMVRRCFLPGWVQCR